MFASISRGWSLTKMSFKVLSLDKEILFLPVLAAITLVVAVVGIGGGLFGLGFFPKGDETWNVAQIAVLFGIYVLAYAIAIFFNAAVVEMATIRFNGGDPTLKDGLRKSWSRIGRILQWAVVAATVGIIFRILRDQAKDNILARILVSFLETGWNIATYFVVPILVYQDVGPFSAIKGSMGTMKRTFGESIVGMAGTGIIFFLLGLLGLIPLLIGVSLLQVSLVLGLVFIALAVVYWLGLAAVNSAVDGILVAALYKYAQEGRLPTAYEQQGLRVDGLAW